VSPGFAFDFHRARDEFVGQFSKLYLRVSIADSVSQFTTRVGLTSQVDRTSGHGRLRAALLVKLGCNAKAEKRLAGLVCNFHPPFRTSFNWIV
jgi:hypothetical protein